MIASAAATGRRMRDCRWAARRLSAYRDIRTSPVLSHAEVLRIERHLMSCPRCLDVTGELAWLADVLRRYGARTSDDATVRRLQAWTGTAFARPTRDEDRP